MKVGVVGLGHIGVVNVAGMLELGHMVVGFDVDEAVRDRVAQGVSPFGEPGVTEILASARAAQKMTVGTIDTVAIEADAVFVCVGTPGRDDDCLDLSAVETVARDLGSAVRRRSNDSSPLLLAIRSTLPPGSMDAMVMPALAEAAGELPGRRYEAVYLPDFGREGSALTDFLTPSRIVVGAQRPDCTGLLNELFTRLDAPVITTSFRTAELAKLADNAFHALKVVFANEMGRYALRSGIAPGDLFEIFRADTKLNISDAYLRPGAAFGGPCLSKDLRALTSAMQQVGVSCPVLAQVGDSNRSHTDFLVEEIDRRTKASSRILIVGLTYKPATDDVRDSPFVPMAQALLERGHDVFIHDPDLGVDGDDATIPPFVSPRILPTLPPEGRWDLIVATKDMPRLLANIREAGPILRIYRL